MIIIENRASVILYNFLKSNNFQKPFLLPANICPIVPTVFIKANTKFEFVDIDDSQIIDFELVFNRMKLNKYSGLVFVHSYGKFFDTSNFYKELKNVDNQICIIDDKCLCIPEIPPIDFNDFADLVIYSTGYSKFVDIGYGGWGSINNRFIYERHFQKFDQNEYNNLMDLHKKCLLTGEIFCLKKDSNWLNLNIFDISIDNYFLQIHDILERVKRHKAKINAIYKNELPDYIQLNSDYNNWRFNILVRDQDRDSLLEFIFSQNMYAGKNYPSVSNMFLNSTSPKAEKYGNSIINLFNDEKISEGDAWSLTKIIRKYLSKTAY